MESQEKHILIADNQYLIIRSLERFVESVLHAGIAEVVGTKLQLMQRLNEGISLLIIDTNNLDFDGPGDMQSVLSGLPIPVLVLTNTITKADLAELNAMGLRNFVLKTADE